MEISDLKKFTLFLLQQYQDAWQENAALRAMLASVPMSDGTMGIPGWKQTLVEHLADEEALKIVNEKFAPIYAGIEKLQTESDLLELLRKVPPVGGIQ